MLNHRRHPYPQPYPLLQAFQGPLGVGLIGLACFLLSAGFLVMYTASVRQSWRFGCSCICRCRVSGITGVSLTDEYAWFCNKALKHMAL